ncbi:protein delta homolog 2-like [Xyrauchen texanus]|uniref:protein delta homolog 2-like n=1 Tax=Xyrauchen texanus TaxID=154827 RepID=UPI002241C05A|nr:protein delta homolog 2-like [Xyrauchen texanus]XP_051946512.1 protein delta homolog 2-like [Xyrauchen texanus]XP_051946513.1 protein delta homolog 2-like [Xyrauchen texanus]
MKITEVLLLCCCCMLLIQNCEAQVSFSPEETAPTPSASNCMCELGHGKCAENGDCRCDPGWGGPRCDDCVRMPGCLHGTCHQPWQCTCMDGWAGRFCDKDIYVCSREQPCQNGATCVLNESGEYNCLCTEGFHGRNCELKTGPCQKTKSPCKNGGLCEDLGGYAPELSCRCLAGFTGPRCETNMDDCLMRPCANGATCLDGVNRFSCLCPAGFTGRFCTINQDDCASQPCRNGGRCVDRVTNFQCFCPPGYTGRTCEIPLWETGSPAVSPNRDGSRRGGQDSVTQSKSPPGNDSRGTTANGDERHLLKISVKEVVTQQGAAGLSDLQLIILLVLGGMTLAVVALTAGLVLCGHCQDRSARCQCRPPPTHHYPFHRCRTQRQHSVPAQQECKISFLETPAPSELEKKRLNTDII